MTIKQLKETLNQFPEKLQVLVDGYQGGFSEISIVKSMKVKLNVNSEDDYGPHDEDKNADTGWPVFWLDITHSAMNVFQKKQDVVAIQFRAELDGSLKSINRDEENI